uniref:Uncharacterized protein n=1 Tax=Magallana gigas TaxID=29159 RepID=A0A8W8MK92_MAGGI
MQLNHRLRDNKAQHGLLLPPGDMGFADEKKDCDIANITTCDESEESSGDEVPLGKRIPKKKSFGTEFATGSTLETDSSKTSCNNPVLPAPPQPPKRSSSKTQKSSGVANQRKAPQRISSSKSPSPARSSRSRGNSRRQSFSQLSRYRSRSRENRFGQYSSSRENNRRQCSNSSRNSHRKTLSQMSRSRSRENSHRPSSRSRENSRHRTTSQLSRSTSSSAYPMSEEKIRDNVKKGNPFNSIVQSGSDDNTLDQNLTLEDFKDFNLSLNVKKDYDICKSIVAQIGGNDYKDHIKKAMQRDNEDELSRSFKNFEEEWLRLGQEFSSVFDAGQENPERYQALEKRTCTRGPPRTTKYSPVSPEYSPATPEYSPAILKSPTHVPLESFLTSPGNNPTPLQAPLTSLGYPIGCFTQQTSPDQYPLKEEVTALCELVDSVRVDLLQKKFP